MDINIIALGVMTLVMGYLSYTAFFNVKEGFVPSTLPAPLVPMQVGKARSFVNKTSDASMYIENQRRKAIIGGNRVNNPSRAFWHKHFSNGIFEYINLTGICPPGVCGPVFPNGIVDPGHADIPADAFIFEGGDAVMDVDAFIVDFGGAQL